MAISKVIYGNDTLIDLTEDSVTPETLAEGATAHDASGNVIHGVGKTTSVLFTEQTLTDTQKEQARENIGALAESELQGGIDTALAQAKASGEFKGEKGYTPVKGIDYFTEADKQEIAEQAAQLVDIPEGGVTSWNDLTDKPFGEEQAFEPIVWDGNFDEANSFAFGDMFYTRISNAILTPDLLDGAKAVCYDDNGELRYDGGEAGAFDAYTLYVNGGLDSTTDAILVVVDKDTASAVAGISAPSNGIYSIADPELGSYVLSITKETVKPLDEKYIPDTIARVDDIPDIPEVPTKLSELENDVGFITKDDIPESSSGATPDWSVNDPNAAGYIKNRTHYSEMVEGAFTFEGDLTGKEYYDIGNDVLLVKMSDTPLSMEELLGSTVTVKHNIAEFGADGDTILEFVSNEDNIVVEQLDETNYAIVVVTEFNEPAVMVVNGDLSSVGFPLSEGTYFLYTTMDEGYFYAQSLSCLNGMQEVVHKIDEKYLPASVVLEGELEKKGYQTEEQVTELINNGLEDKGYQTEAQVTELIDTALEVGVKVSYEDLTDVPVGKYRYYVIPKLQVQLSKFWRIISYDWRMSLYGEKIYFDGKVYDAPSVEKDGVIYIVGNPSLAYAQYEDNGIPIAFKLELKRDNNGTWVSQLSVRTTDDNPNTTHTVALFDEREKQLDEKYLPTSVVLEGELEKKGYQTEEQVTELINNALGVIENAKY